MYTKKNTDEYMQKWNKVVTALYTDYGKLRITKMRKVYKKKDGIFVDALA